MVLCYFCYARQMISIERKKIMKNFEVHDDYLVRTAIDLDTDTTYYSVNDVIDVLFDNECLLMYRNYWAVWKHRLKKKPELSWLAECEQAKMMSKDEKRHPTDVVTLDGALNILVYICYVSDSSSYMRSVFNHHVDIDILSFKHTMIENIVRCSETPRSDYM